MDLNFLLNNDLIVFSTTRALREYKQSVLNQNLNIKKTFALSEFLKRAVIFENLKEASASEQLLLMQEAALKTKNLHEKLGIKLEFFAFLNSKEYLFSFFKELKREKVSIDMLKASDTYANYDEHLNVLKQLESNYLTLLQENGLYDDISAPSLYKINENFIKEFKNIYIHIDGIPSKYEIEIFEKISKLSSVSIIFTLTKFNEKLKEILKPIFSQNLEVGFDYEISLTDDKILQKTQIVKNNTQILIQPVGLASLQAAFVFDEISKMTRSGIKPENIAVILPNEEFARILRNLDENNMLNFAMSKNFCDTKEFILFDILNMALKAEISSLDDESLFSISLKQLGIDDEKYKQIRKIFSKNFNKFEKFILDYTKNSILEVQELINKELFVLSNFKDKLKNNELLELFLLDLKGAKISLAGGGKVTAMGLLESRGLMFEGVIIVDFNDNFVPQSSQKEMFLSSAVRAKAGLISHQDRENLQKSYYEKLINKAKFLSISYVKDDESVISRFAKELDLQGENELRDEVYIKALRKFDNSDKRQESNFNDGLKHDFFESELSFSRLNTYLKCHKYYYYKYVLKLSEPTGFDSDLSSLQAGNILHETLQEYFSKNPNFCDAKKLEDMIRQKMQNQDKKVIIKLEQIILELENFANKQNEHFEEGWRVKGCEVELKNEFNGVKLTGKIDRIDERNNELFIIDYKTGKNASNLQLEFYKALSGAKNAKFIFFNDNKDEDNNKDKNLDLVKILDEIKEENKKGLDFNCSCNSKNHNNEFSLLLEGIK